MKTTKADKWFSIYIRLRDSIDEYCTCITCGAVRHWRNLDCGHWIKRQHMGTRFDERNCASQCKQCNYFEQGRSAEHEAYIIKRYGYPIRDLLKSAERNCKKYSTFELDLLADHYEEKAKNLANIKGITI